MVCLAGGVLAWGRGRGPYSGPAPKFFRLFGDEEIPRQFIPHYRDDKHKLLCGIRAKIFRLEHPLPHNPAALHACFFGPRLM